jgi:DNA-binding transcriptional LysR family regulator
METNVHYVQNNEPSSEVVMRNLDVSQLRAFVTVVETGGMTAAGNVLHLTQAAVSQQMKKLEDTLGCQLVERDRRGLRLTDSGERLFGRAKRLLAVNDEIWSEMTTEVYSGQVRLGVPYDLVATYLPGVLRTFSRAHPRVEITLVCKASPVLKAALLAGELDLALVEEPVPGGEGELLATDRLVWVGARGGDAYQRRPLPVASCESCAFRPSIFDALRSAEIPFRVVTDSSNLDASSATVQTDLAVVASLASTVPDEMSVLGASSGLPTLPTFSINLYLSRAGVSGPVEALAHGLREAFIGRSQKAA